MSRSITVEKALTLDDPRAREYGTAKGLEALDGLLEHGTIGRAAKALGITAQSLRNRLGHFYRRAARQGWSPAHDMDRTAPLGHHVKGVSTYYSIDPETGEKRVRGQWVKTNKDAEQKIADMLDAFSSMVEDYRAASDPIDPPDVELTDDLLAVYPMGDPHLGMFSWAQETGEDFDVRIAERELYGAVDALVSLAPPAREALVINLGDFFHADSPDNRTARAGHALDVDTRWAKVLRIGFGLMRRIIDRALAKHETVRVINEIGNHDDNSSVFLSVALHGFYENNPRVIVDDSPSTFHWYRFGKCLIGTTHGNGPKLAALPGIMATDKPQDWGETKHREWYVGHVHHDQRKEYPGCSVETYRTLAPRDAWHNSKGYRSGRDMKLDVWHREHGKIQRHIVGIARILG